MARMDTSAAPHDGPAAVMPQARLPNAAEAIHRVRHRNDEDLTDPDPDEPGPGGEMERRGHDRTGAALATG